MYLDHVILAVRDLAADARRLGDALGLVVHPGGEHPGVGTHNAIVRVGSSYIELIAVHDAALARQQPFGARLLDALDLGPGWFGFALGVDDLDRVGSEISARGLVLGEARVGSRVRPDGHELRWRTAAFETSPAFGGVLPFLIQHESPLEVRAGTSVTRHPLGATAVNAVGAGVADLDAWTPTFVALTGQPPTLNAVNFVQAQRANWRLDDGALVRLLRPEHPTTGPVAEHIARRGEGLFIIRLAVHDLDDAAAELARRGTPVSERQEDGTVFVLDARRTLGARFALVEQR